MEGKGSGGKSGVEIVREMISVGAIVRKGMPKKLRATPLLLVSLLGSVVQGEGATDACMWGI